MRIKQSSNKSPIIIDGGKILKIEATRQSTEHLRASWVCEVTRKFLCPVSTVSRPAPTQEDLSETEEAATIYVPSEQRASAWPRRDTGERLPDDSVVTVRQHLCVELRSGSEWETRPDSARLNIGLRQT